MFDSARTWLAARLVPSAEQRAAILGVSPRYDPSSLMALTGGRLTTSGIQVNAAQALGISAFWRGVNLYARTIAALDLRVMQRDSRGGYRPARDDPRYDILSARPNRWTPRVNFWEAIIAHALTQKTGGYAEIEWSARGLQVLGLHLMDPRTTAPVVNPDRSVEYRYKVANNQEKMPAADVLHIRGLGWDGIAGYDLVGLAAETLGVARAQVLYEGALYGNGAVASGYFEVPGDKTPKQLADMRAEIMQVHGGAARGGKFGFLTAGTTFKPTSYSPADAKITEAQKAKVVEIANLLGVPPHMLGVMDGATVGNAEQQTLAFVKFSLMPWLRSIEGELDLKLFSPQERRKGLCVRHDVRDLERGDMAARMTYWEKRLMTGSASPNEIALAEGDEPSAEAAADYRFVPTNNLTALNFVTGKPTQPATSEPKDDAAIKDDGAAQSDDNAG